MQLMWYATDSTGAIMQQQAEGGWLTIGHHHPDVSRAAVKRMNQRLVETYRDNGFTFSAESLDHQRKLGQL